MNTALKQQSPMNTTDKLPETPPEAPVQKSIYPTGAPSIDPPATPINTATPIGTETLLDQGQKMTEKKRTRKRRSRLISEGAEPNEPHSKPPETPVQSSVYPIVALSMDPTIPLPAPPVDTATLLDQGQKMTKKKRMRKRRSMLISEGAEPSEPHSKPPETPVQSSVYPIIALSMDPTIPVSAPPVDTATPVDQEQMTKRKRKKRRKSTAETPVQKTEEPPTENSMGGCNAEPAAKTPVQITNSLGVTKSPFKQNGEGSVRCRACRQLGHKFQHCLRLKCLSKDEEVCFFCGEIGHSLGKCSVSRAGGGRFAKCLFCYERGHFSYNCPRNGHEIYPKVVAANGVMNRTAVEAEGEPLAEV
ncbi:titin-like isoform X1 [Spatholobus suberectus]|nr:titin-like isoform X1 [Spatholobus suberectus]